MIVTVANIQYRPVSNAEVTANAALSVRLATSFCQGIDNYAYRVGNFKLLSVFAPVGWSSVATTAERVILPFAGRYVPDAFRRCTSVFGVQRTAGADEIEWRLYASTNPYQGPQIMDTDYLATGYKSTNVASSTDAHQVLTTQNLEIVRNSEGLIFFTLTAQSADGTAVGKLTTLDVWPELI